MGSEKAPKARTFATRINFPAKVRGQMVEMLNQQLADSLDLHSQTKQAHWNVKGSDFYQLHLLFAEHAGHVTEWIDMIAERAVMLGGFATGTARMAAASSTLTEFPADITSGKDHVSALADRWAS